MEVIRKLLRGGGQNLGISARLQILPLAKLQGIEKGNGEPQYQRMELKDEYKRNKNSEFLASCTCLATN